MLVTVKELLESVLNYRSYPKNNLGIRLFGPPCTVFTTRVGPQASTATLVERSPSK